VIIGVQAEAQKAMIIVLYRFAMSITHMRTSVNMELTER
jgi:hypothetical protein